MKQSDIKTDIKIEQLTTFSSEDAEAIRQLAAKIGPNFKPLSDLDFQEMLASPTTHLFVARPPKGQIVGMVTLILYRIPYVKKAYIDDLVVDEAYRGQGIASELMKTVVVLAKDLGASHIDFTARPRREANKLYEKLGFKKRDTNVYRLIYDYAEI